MNVDGYRSKAIPTRDKNWIVLVPEGSSLEVLPPGISEEIGELLYKQTFDLQPARPNHGIIGVRDPNAALEDLKFQGFYVCNTRAEVLLDRTRKVVEDLVKEGRATFNNYPATEGSAGVGISVCFGGVSFYTKGNDVDEAKESLAKILEERAREREAAENDWRRITPLFGRT